MKYLLNIILLLTSVSSFGQNDLIKDFVSQVFFGYDVTKKPDKIESQSYRPFDYGDSYTEKNIVKFSSHPLTKSVINGQYNVKYLFFKNLFDDYGIYQLDMTLTFDNYKSCKEMFEKLKRMCSNNASYESLNLGRENAPKSEKCIYDYDEKLQLPRIALNYHRGPHTINIKVYTTYSFSKFKKYTNRLW